MNQADLDEQAAKKVIDVVKSYLSDKLPEAIEEPVINALDGLDIDDAGDMLGKLGGLFKKD